MDIVELSSEPTDRVLNYEGSDAYAVAEDE